MKEAKSSINKTVVTWEDLKYNQSFSSGFSSYLIDFEGYWEGKWESFSLYQSIGFWGISGDISDCCNWLMVSECFYFVFSDW